MNWRLHLSDHPVLALDLLAGDPVLLAVWTSAQDVQFFHAETGADYGAMHITQVGPGEGMWQLFVNSLRAPNGAYFPVVNAGQVIIHTSHDGRLRLYHYPENRLVLEADDQHVGLERSSARTLLAVGLDRELGTVCALDEQGWLHVYQQQIYVGAYLIAEQSDSRPGSLLVPDAAAHVWVIDDSQIQAIDMAGQVQGRMAAHGAWSNAACAPDGQVLVVSEMQQERFTAYDAQLRPICRGAVVDLMAGSKPLQLFEEAVYQPDVVMPMAVADDGRLAFALNGTVCVTSLAEFRPLPRPRRLF